jgi:hypothetical protein
VDSGSSKSLLVFVATARTFSHLKTFTSYGIQQSEIILSAELSGSKVILDDKDRHLWPVRRMYGTLLTNVTNYLFKNSGFEIRDSRCPTGSSRFKIPQSGIQNSSGWGTFFTFTHLNLTYEPLRTRWGFLVREG